MPRPRKCRKVCSFPNHRSFSPTEDAPPLPPVILTVDEYETLRLIDKECLSQEDCALRMNVAQRFSLSTPTPGGSWRMYWWRGAPCGSRAAIFSCAMGSIRAATNPVAPEIRFIINTKSQKEYAL